MSSVTLPLVNDSLKNIRDSVVGSSSSLRTLALVSGDLKYSIRIPASLYPEALKLRDELAALPPQPASPNEQPPTGDGVSHLELSSEVELAAAYLDYVRCQMIEEGQNDARDSLGQLLDFLLDDFDHVFLRGRPVQAIVAALATERENKLDVLRGYYAAYIARNKKMVTRDSALFRAADDGAANIYTVFGGQGISSDYFEELREICNIYPAFVTPLLESSSRLLKSLSKTVGVERFYSNGLDVMRWLKDRETTPPAEYMTTAPISLPLIGLVQLAHFTVMCKVLGLTPGEFLSHISGSTGHSQGIVIAAAIAAADSWESYQKTAASALKILFSIGSRSQQVCPQSSIPPAVMQDLLDHNEGAPTPMLSIRNLPQAEVQKQVDQLNRYLPEELHGTISLINSRKNIVVTGAPISLAGLNVQLRALKAPPGLDQTRIPWKERKLTFTIPSTGEDLRSGTARGENLVPTLIQLILKDAVNWAKATAFDSATHIIDFGPGGDSGVGVLTHRNKEGTGVRIILASSLEGKSFDVGYQGELLDCSEGATVKYFGLPPLMVAGMTPTTVHHDFVSATMNAGYHIELAGGGYYNAQDMTKAIQQVAEAAPAGRGICVNLIYANPQTVQWQIPMIRKLISEGVPIEGMTIGAGVPSLNVAQEYISTIGLKYISFKPGSVETIQAVINIAIANPTFPIMLQWTGGRGGGHHSFEDFHQPILQMYHSIRKHENIILVGGSGFSGLDTYPYLTGIWSNKYGKPAMPFDGFLFGSRMMVAKEAHTSRDSKLAIVAAEGISDEEWEKTYKGPAGGVITVQSEMGEPIHKLATRGVKLWAEMEKMVFNLSPADRLKSLQKNRAYIIKKLNDDFQKVWFGRNRAGKAVDLSEMTYAEVITRVVDLLYIKHEARWIDKTYKVMTGDFIRRAEALFIRQETEASMLQSYDQLNDPYPTIEQFRTTYPEADYQIIGLEDEGFFLQLCRRRGQKPPPFIPALDENFEVYFKKDSLWQSENLQAVMDQDVGRTCILQGPVAVKDMHIIDEPVKQILDTINNGFIASLLKDLYGDDESQIPVIEYCGGELLKPAPRLDLLLEGDGLTTRMSLKQHGVTYDLSFSAPMPDINSWMALLGGEEKSPRYALFRSATVVQDHNLQPNPMQRIFVPVPGLLVEIVYPNDPTKTRVIMREQGAMNSYIDVVTVSFTEANEIIVSMVKDSTASGEKVALELKYEYRPDTGYAPIREVMDGRIDRIKEFYWRIWFGRDIMNPNAAVRDIFNGGSMTITAEAIESFAHAVNNSSEAFADHPDRVMYAPMDFAIVLGWKAVTKPIFCNAINGDLLQLVHLSNSFQMIADAKPLQLGDNVEVTSKINAVINQESGRMTEVCATITRDDEPVVKIVSQFLFRGKYTDSEGTFQDKVETPWKVHLAKAKDVAVLRSKQWFFDNAIEPELIGKTLIFQLQSSVQFKTKNIFSHVHTWGEVLLKDHVETAVLVGNVEYEADDSHGNPVIDYLERHGAPIEVAVDLENPLSLSNNSPLKFRAPSSNELYAVVSGDFNPIHVSRVFSNFAELPGTITHGMYTSAAVRSLVETWATGNDIGRMRNFSVSLVGMVLPNDDIEVQLQHVGMISGRKIIKIEATSKNESEPVKVLIGEAEVEQPPSSYLFTGQGSQEQGMGMDLYASSAVARKVWDRADKFFMDNYGFAITDIVRNNPKELKIHFGGPRGIAIRSNYMDMTFEIQRPDGSTYNEKMFKEITENTASYTFTSATGLLNATQFTQPALTLTEKAIFEDMLSKGLIPNSSTFAGHSLGEYSALAALTDILPIESLVSVVFYRGLTMQVAVTRDAQGRSNYGMCAVDPRRVNPDFNEDTLQFVINSIQEETGWLLEIVNYNVADMQYVCAGDVRALDSLTAVTNHIHKQKIPAPNLTPTANILNPIIQAAAAATIAKATTEHLKLQRGVATIPLHNIDVPFHSSFLRRGVHAFRQVLLKHFDKEKINPEKLIGKYVPNVTARPFEVTKEYFEMVCKLTGSPELEKVLANWEKYKDVDIGRGNTVVEKVTVK